MYYNIIVACDSKRGIGLDGKIPWNIKEDIKHFRRITSNVPNDPYYNYINVVVMGRKTWNSIPDEYKPLENRLNIILTSNKEKFEQELKDIIGINLDMIRIASKMDDIFDIVNKFNRTNNSTNNSNGASLGNSNFSNENKVKTPDLNFKQNKINEIFIIGGSSVYKEAIKSGLCRHIYLTEIYGDFKCDVFFPSFNIKTTKRKNELDNKILECERINNLDLDLVNSFTDDEEIDNIFRLSSVSKIYSSISSSDTENKNKNEIYYRFLRYSNISKNLDNDFSINPEEEKYLETMKDILINGIFRMDRTLIGSYFISGVCLKYDIRNSFPISTTKKIVLRWIFEELKLYLSGKTDTKILSNQGITIWDANTTREFLDKRGLTDYPEGDMGETYGFNFRHFGGKYINCHTDYDNSVGYDQLENAINLIKNDPTSRRIIINLWNPATQHKATLPSCLFYYQFCVDVEKKELHCIIHLRSSDYFLANNWNTCTGTLLTYMICNLKGIDLKPATITVMVSDAHIYKNHISQVFQNLTREPYPYPMLKIKEKKDNITDFNFDDLLLIGYKSHPSIKADMAV